MNNIEISSQNEFYVKVFLVLCSLSLLVMLAMPAISAIRNYKYKRLRISPNRGNQCKEFIFAKELQCCTGFHS